MKPVTFQSCLTPAFNDFVAFKQLQGYDYTHGAKHLRPFDAFLVQEHFDKPYLTAHITQAYVAHSQVWGATTRYTRLASTRDFSRYLHLRQPQSYVMRDLPRRGPVTRRFYLYREEEIQALMHQARQLRPAQSLRPHTYATLVGLLAVTGLRIGEALALDLDDLNQDDRLLRVRRGKFGKDRLLPLADSTMQALRTYLQHRQAFGFAAPTDPFFISRFGRRFPYDTVNWTFGTLVQRSGLAPDSPHRPRLHDLRHTFATRCLLHFYEQGHDINAKLPLLVTYLGHVSIECTALYPLGGGCKPRGGAMPLIRFSHKPPSGLSVTANPRSSSDRSLPCLRPLTPSSPPAALSVAT